MERPTKISRKITDLTRAELHKLVWERPLIRLSPELCISAPGLAAACKHNHIPYPSGGHWTKITLGHNIEPERLPAPSPGMGDRIEAPPRRKTPIPMRPVPRATPAVQIAKVPDVTLNVAELHPLVRAWVSDHERLQRERSAAIAGRKKQNVFWPLTEIADLTPRDVYRFRMSSVLLQSLEKAGVRIKQATVDGRMSFAVGPHTIECVVVEKMTRRPSTSRRSWTAFPNHHQGGLVSKGFLRITITTYLQPAIPEWVETPNRKMDALIPDIVTRIVGASACLDRMADERRERERVYAEQVARREEISRLRQLEKTRFERLNELSIDWHRARQLNFFVAELEQRLGTKGDIILEGRTLSGWIAWARQKTDGLNPFRKETLNVFKDFVGGNGF